MPYLIAISIDIELPSETRRVGRPYIHAFRPTRDVVFFFETFIDLFRATGLSVGSSKRLSVSHSTEFSCHRVTLGKPAVQNGYQSMRASARQGVLWLALAGLSEITLKPQLRIISYLLSCHASQPPCAMVNRSIISVLSNSWLIENYYVRTTGAPQ